MNTRRISFRIALVALVIFVLTGCLTATRRAAITDLAQKEVACVEAKAAIPGKTPTQAIAECGIPHDSAAIQDYIDLFTGAQARALCADAGPDGGVCVVPVKVTTADAGQ